MKLRHKVGETGGGKSGRAPPEVRALQQEIALLEDLHHPNIVKYLGTQVLGARLYIYLSYASDGSLARTVAHTRSTRGERRSTTVMLVAVAAVAAAPAVAEGCGVAPYAALWAALWAAL